MLPRSRAAATVPGRERDGGGVCVRRNALAVLERERRDGAHAAFDDADVRPRRVAPHTTHALLPCGLLTRQAHAGPGDCGYSDQLPFEEGKLPAARNPASASRVVGHVQWNGMRDGVDAGQRSCQVCFQHGKDVRCLNIGNRINSV